MPTASSTVDRSLEMIRTEYQEFPGLSLTEPQVQRLWQLDADTTSAVLQSLLLNGFLKRTRRGAYVRADLSTL
jgi:hypothetical protein